MTTISNRTASATDAQPLITLASLLMPLTPIKQPRFNMDLRTQGYVFTVALFAAIFVGLLLFRPRGAVRVAESQVRYEFTELTTDRGVPIDPQATTVVRQHMYSELTSHEFLAPIVDRVGLSEAPMSSSAINELARRISMQIEPDGESALLIAMRFEATNPTLALSFADGMATQFLERHNHAQVVEQAAPPEPTPPSEERTFAVASVEQWEHRVTQVAKEQQAYVQRQLEQMETLHRAGEDFSGIPLDRVAAKPAQAFIQLPQANPHWIKLQNELRDAQQEIEVMLETYTPAHPVVLQMFSDIEAIRQELGRTSRTVVGADSSDAGQLANIGDEPTSNGEYSGVAGDKLPANSNRDGQFNEIPSISDRSQFAMEPPTASIADTESPGINALQPPNTSTIAAPSAGDDNQMSTTNVPRVASANFDAAEALLTIKSSAEYRQFAAKLRAATDKLNQSRQHLANLPVPKPQQPVAEVVVTAQPESSAIRAPARITSVLRPPFTSASALQLFGPATLFAFVLSIGRRPTRLPDFLCSEDDVANTLGLPIISGVSKPKGPIFEMPENKTPKPVVIGIRLCEAIAVICVMMIVMGLVTQPDFARHMTSNPFDAFCIGLDHLQAFFTRLLP